MTAMNIIDLIGNTPLVELTKVHTNKNVRIYAKMEGHNPGGSVKDRPAANMILSAYHKGLIGPGKKLIEATSGNTGIALAMVACSLGIPIELVMPENSTKERLWAMQAFGADITLLESIEVCRDYAMEKSAHRGYYLLNQFANPDNYMAHYHSTGPEIWQQTNGEITHFVSAMGTTGTIMGTSMYLKEKSSDVRIIGCQPTENSSIPGKRRWASEYLPEIFDPARIDELRDVSEAEAKKMARILAREEGIFSGMSTGGAATIAFQLASEIERGTIVFI
jgi:S-sulfo-L-cysteine synthase (O-acetyl-L-serine-dependent)